MKIFTTINALQAHIKDLGAVAYVPTMGNLHAGHLALVRQAKSEGLPVVVSIFVNPLQFLPHEDFHAYPRTLEKDFSALVQEQCDIVFAPNVDEIYPSGKEAQTFRITPPSTLADILEGEFRPGFFTGVCTVVLKFLNIVRPHTLWLGKKDYQQWRVLSGMITQMNLPIIVQAGDTIRESDGLALSSRNGYLNVAERKRAIELSQALQLVANSIKKLPDIRQFRTFEQQAMQSLNEQGWITDYIAIRDPQSLQAPQNTNVPLIILGAAKIGSTRLIDNLEYSPS